MEYTKRNVDAERDAEIFGIVRENYNRVNHDFLKSQIRVALKQPTMTKEETLEGLLEWCTTGGGTGLNEYYRPFLFNAISHLMR